jgi:type I restriction enzyme S subunit
MKVKGWPLRPLGRCAKFLSGGTPSKARPEFWDGDIPWVSSGEMARIRIHDTSLRITPEAAEEGSRLVPENTVLAVVRGMSLAKEFRVAITRREVAFNQDLKAFACVPDIDPEFLFYALFARREHIRELATEASHGTKKLDTDVLAAVQLPVPNSDLQRRTVAVVSTYDDLIENNQRRTELLEDAARLLYQEWFLRLRFPGYEHTRTTAGVPAGWERIPFEDALVLQRGFDLPETQWQDGAFPICGSNGIIGHHIEARVKGPGVYTGRSGSLGVVNYACEDYWPHNTALWVREFKKVTPLFALFLLREMNLKQYNGGASVPTLDRKAVHRVPVLIPPPKLITLFDEQLGPLFAQLRNLRQQTQKLRAARDLLLPRLMSGEIAV